MQAARLAGLQSGTPILHIPRRHVGFHTVDEPAPLVQGGEGLIGEQHRGTFNAVHCFVARWSALGALVVQSLFPRDLCST